MRRSWLQLCIPKPALKLYEYFPGYNFCIPGRDQTVRRMVMTANFVIMTVRKLKLCEHVPGYNFCIPERQQTKNVWVRSWLQLLCPSKTVGVISWLQLLYTWASLCENGDDCKFCTPTQLAKQTHETQTRFSLFLGRVFSPFCLPKNKQEGWCVKETKNTPTCAHRYNTCIWSK